MVALNVARTGGVVEIMVRVVKGVLADLTHWLYLTTLCFLVSFSVSKKLAPIPPKVPFGQQGSMADHSTGQPSPLSLSPTPPSTPSPYGLSYPQGYSLASGPVSPAAAPSLASPSVFTSTLTKSRPTPKPRQRPTLPPPQPPTVNLPASSPQSTEHPVIEGMSPGESMSTGNQATTLPHHSMHLSKVPTM